MRYIVDLGLVKLRYFILLISGLIFVPGSAVYKHFLENR